MSLRSLSLSKGRTMSKDRNGPQGDYRSHTLLPAPGLSTGSRTYSASSLSSLSLRCLELVERSKRTPPSPRPLTVGILLHVIPFGGYRQDSPESGFPRHPCGNSFPCSGFPLPWEGRPGGIFEHVIPSGKRRMTQEVTVHHVVPQQSAACGIKGPARDAENPTCCISALKMF